MLAYLVRHGEAMSELEDPARPLSELGRDNIRRICDHISQRIKFFPGHIFHSPKARASQTAVIISKSVPGAPAPVLQVGLLPLDDPSIWGDLLPGMDRDVVLVGHLPHLSKLASLLLHGNPDRDIIDFTPGTVLCMEKTADWKVKWMLSPRLLKGEGRL